MRARATSAAVLAVLALATGCGADDEGDPIPSEQASALLAQLGSVSDRIANGSSGACRDVLTGEDNNLDQVQATIDSLPQDVDEDVRDALQQSFDHLFDLVGQECRDLEEEEAQTEPDTTTTEPETDTEPETVTVPPETQTVPPDTTPTTPTAPTTPEAPTVPGGGNDGGGAGVPGDDG
jgi:hypothetical protein